MPIRAYSSAMEGRLFDEPDDAEAARGVPAAEAPLAVRMRPRSLDELVGQEHLLARGLGASHRGRDRASRTRRSSTGRPGPARPRWPGSSPARPTRRLRGGVGGERRQGRGAGGDRAGRASAARIGPAARSSSSTRSTASTRRSRTRCCPRSRRACVTLIGATTENPYFEVNSALLSRCQIYELHALGAGRDRGLLRRALADPERGIADPPEVDDEALELLAHRSGGDARDRARGARARGRDRPRRRRSRRPRNGRGRPSAQGGRATTARATSTTTTSRPGSRRRAARTPTRRSTTWR